MDWRALIQIYAPEAFSFREIHISFIISIIRQLLSKISFDLLRQ